MTIPRSKERRKEGEESPMRGSILTRPLRPPSRVNQESIDHQFAKEQALLDLRRAKFQATEETVRANHSDGTAKNIDVKMHKFEENKESFLSHKELQLQAQERQRLLDLEAARVLREAEERDRLRQMSDKQRKQEEARLAMEENLRIIEEKKARARAEQEAERQKDRENQRLLEVQHSQRRFR